MRITTEEKNDLIERMVMLLRHEELTANQLAEKLDIERRRAYRYLRLLAAEGHDVVRRWREGVHFYAVLKRKKSN